MKRDKVRNFELKSSILDIDIGESLREKTTAQAKNHERLFGQRLVFFDADSLILLERLHKLRRSKYPTVFCGEAGTGKTSLAVALHFNRTKKWPTILVACPENPQELYNEIQRIIKSKKPSGIVIRNFHHMGHLANEVLRLAIKNTNGTIWFYLTVEDTSYLSATAPYSQLLSTFSRFLQISISPLRERQKDLIHQFVLFSINQNIDCNFLSKDYLKSLLAYDWPGNSAELAAMVGLLADYQPSEVIRALGQQVSSTLSPLEQCERKAVIRYLHKNKFNKSRTHKDLRITINTLNSKIEKYKIAVPKLHQGRSHV